MNGPESTEGFLLEAIKVSYHLARMKSSHKEIYGEDKDFDFTAIQEQTTQLPKGRHKLRISYGLEQLSYTIHPYELRQIYTLKVVFDDHISYPYKYADRSQLTSLYNQKGDCDDILIVRRELITDSYYCNVAFEKEGLWYTPRRPLLKGTKRQSLLDTGQIAEADILLETLHLYTRLRLFNAMIDFGEIELAIGAVS